MLDVKKYIGQKVEVIVDRALGTKHPKFDFVYLVNYGYVPHTVSGDGKEIDAYVLGVDKPLKNFTGRCIAVIYRRDDDDPKLVVVPDGLLMADEEITSAVHFQEQWFDSYIKR